MKLKGILSLPLLVALAAAFAQSSAAPQVSFVRGMLEGNTTAKTPAPGVLVTVESNNYTSPAVKSGKDGLYYIPNLTPGNYTLQVWADPKSPLSFPITVKGSLTDVPPVIVANGNAVKVNPSAANSKTGDGNKAKPAPPPAKRSGAPAPK
jgi:hypothetical protein